MARDAEPEDWSADEELFRRLQDKDFTGTEYDRVEQRLIAYATAVLMSMVIAETLLSTARTRTGHGVAGGENFWQLLRQDPAARSGLVIDVLIEGVTLFRTKGRASWKQEGGASLRTYFVNGCLMCVGNAVRRWKRQECDARAEPRGEALSDGEDPASPTDEVVANRIYAVQLLGSMDRELRVAFYLMVFQSYTQKQAAEHLGITHRALEGRIARFREQWKEGRG